MITAPVVTQTIPFVMVSTHSVVYFVTTPSQVVVTGWPAVLVVTTTSQVSVTVTPSVLVVVIVVG